MRHPMTSSLAFVVAALFAATESPAEPAKAGEHGKSAAHPAKAAPPAQPARARGDDRPGKPHEASPTRGNSAEAHENAPGQNRDEKPALGKPEKDDEKPGELGKTRDQRRRDHRDRLFRHYGSALLQQPAMLAELKTHAWRMARLERVRTLAEALPDADKRAKTIERVDKLVTREKTRHERKLEQLKSQPEPAKPATPGTEPEKRAEKAGGAQ
jgi:hypothetical protein